MCDFEGILKTEYNLQHLTRTFYQESYFVVSVKIKFCQRQAEFIDDDQDKFQSVKDSDNEFTECQTPRKKLQSIGISLVSLHSFMKTLKSNI